QNNTNNSNISTPDATSMVIVESDLGMRCKYGGKKKVLGENAKIKKNNNEIISKLKNKKRRESSSTVSNRRPVSNNGTDIKCDYINNNNCTGRAEPVSNILE
ncbi:5686_t:CDS:2, partial [Paraglomus occultum]